MKKSLIVSFLTLLAFHAWSQADYNLSLSKVRIEADNIRFTIGEVLDGRRDKSQIGWVQTGIANRRRVANLETGFDGEVVSLFNRSGLLSKDQGDSSLTLVVTRLYINEQTEAMSERGTAEIAINFFRKYKGSDSCLYLSTVFISHEGSGMDVTHKHDDRIAVAFSKVIEEFSKKSKNELSSRVLHRDQIKDPGTIMRELSSIPMLHAATFTDGIFKTFDDFVNNASTMDRFMIKEGKAIKVFHVNSDKTKTRARNGIFGFSFGGKLYVLIDGHAYELSREGDRFTFIGPPLVNTTAIATGAVLGGLVGGAIAGAASSSPYSVKFQIDWDLERISEVGIIKN